MGMIDADEFYSFKGDGLDVIEDADSLLAFQRQYEPELTLTKDEAELLLGYFEGHGYCIGTKDGKLFRGDLAVVEHEILWEPYSLDDVIEICCEWNIELLLNEPDGARYAKYKADEVKLDSLFDRTERGKEIKALAEQTA